MEIRLDHKRRLLLKILGMAPLMMFSECNPNGVNRTFNSILDFKNLFDFEKKSCLNLEAEACDFLNGGADDLLTLTANHKAYEEIKLIPNYLVDVSSIVTSLNLLGQKLTSPILLSPVGLNQLFNQEGELAVARGSKASGKMMIASHMTSYSFEEISKSYGSPIWFQMYMTSDKAYNLEILKRVEATGCDTIFLTVDVPVGGNREGHEGYLARIAQKGDLYFGNFKNGMVSTVVPSLNWESINWLRDNTKLKVVLKGIVSPHDASLAVANGVDGIMISNHGGRQLESNRGTIECLAEIRETVGGQFPLIIDGGIRRGTDIVKALALGANAVAIGRPFVWGLTLFGEQGVTRILDILHAELVRDMMLLGVTSLDQIDQSFVRF